MRNCRIFHFENGGGGVSDGHKMVPKSDIYTQDFLKPMAAENFRILPGRPPDPPKKAKFPNASSEKAIFDEKKAEIRTRLERNGHFGLKKGQN